MVRTVFHLPLRQAEGFCGRGVRPDGHRLAGAGPHTTLSQRGPALRLNLSAAPATGPVEVLVDSTGLRVVEVKSGRKGRDPKIAAKRRGWRNARASRSSEPLGDRSAKVEHLIEHLDADAGHCLLGGQAACAQAPTDDPLVARNAGFDQAAPGVAGGPSPGPFAAGLKIDGTRPKSEACTKADSGHHRETDDLR
jgi:hypothetical protein